MSAIELRIARLGAGGDGVAIAELGPVFVPYTLPGELVSAEIVAESKDGARARLLGVIEPSADRVPAPCPHFGLCGGCAVQQAKPALYTAWKREQLVMALGHRGLEMPADARFLPTRPDGRRRASFAAKRRGRDVILGFHTAFSDSIVAIPDCKILSPGLLGALPLLHDLATRILADGQSGDILATDTETGLDLLVAAEIQPRDRKALTQFVAAAPRIARLCWKTGKAIAEPIAQNQTPLLHFAGAAIELPPESFLQPSLGGEAALVAAVTAFAKGSKSIADLYSGCGTFTFPLAKIGKVAAFDAARTAIAALHGAVNRAALSGRVTAQVRDLDGAPLGGFDLRGVDCVVFDPPRAGAASQAEALAASNVPVVVAVSCNPASFARDAKLLVDGGYRMDRLIMIDQFVWSAHLEVVARFSRPAGAR